MTIACFFIYNINGRIVNICGDVVCPRIRWGTHTCRKTGYCFAVAGGAGEMETMQSARHKSYRHAVKYIQDARAVYSTARNEQYVTILSYFLFIIFWMYKMYNMIFIQMQKHRASHNYSCLEAAFRP